MEGERVRTFLLVVLNYELDLSGMTLVGVPVKPIQAPSYDGSNSYERRNNDERPFYN
jgi:hypothetical protein